MYQALENPNALYDTERQKLALFQNRGSQILFCLLLTFEITYFLTSLFPVFENRLTKKDRFEIGRQIQDKMFHNV